MGGNANPETKLFRIVFGYLHFAQNAPDDYRFAFLMNHQLISRLNRDFVALFSPGQAEALNIHGGLISQILNKPIDDKQVTFMTRFIWITLHGLATTNLDKMLFGSPNYEEIKTPFVKEILSGVIEPDLLKKLRKPTKYPQIKPLITPFEESSLAYAGD